jgi:hypothetical protein
MIEGEYVFNTNAKKLCFDIMTCSVAINKKALELRSNWEENGILKFDDDFESVTNNFKLMKALRNTLSLGI